MKTEKEKMILGELYDASDELLTNERLNTRRLLHKLNFVHYTDISERKEIIKSLLPFAPESISIEPPFYCDYGYNIHCGENVFFNFNCILLDVMSIIIGSNVLIGPNVQIYTALHPKDIYERRSGLEYAKPVTIGNDCWIGGSAVLCPGIKIGNGSIIGAGAVVTKDVADNKTVAGNPARPID
jgi:maltose O-acetyltransferase